METLINFIVNINKKRYPSGFDTYKDFVKYQTEFVNSLEQNMIDFYNDLIVRIKNKEIDFYDMEDSANSRSHIVHFYFSKINSNKLVLVGGGDCSLPNKTNNDFYKQLAYVCRTNQIIVTYGEGGSEFSNLSHYGTNYVTGNFDVVIPR